MRLWISGSPLSMDPSRSTTVSTPRASTSSHPPRCPDPKRVPPRLTATISIGRAGMIPPRRLQCRVPEGGRMPADAALLTDIPFFHFLDENERVALAAQLEEVQLPEGQ